MLNGKLHFLCSDRGSDRALYVNCDHVTYCDNFRVDYIPK